MQTARAPLRAYWCAVARPMPRGELHPVMMMTLSLALLELIDTGDIVRLSDQGFLLFVSLRLLCFSLREWKGRGVVCVGCSLSYGIRCPTCNSRDSLERPLVEDGRL